MPRSTFSYKAVSKNDNAVIEQLQQLVDKYPSIGFWQSYYRIRRQGFIWNHKRVYRVYTELKLNIRRRYRKRLPARVKQTLFKPERINQEWS
jgi:putative transposase